jgi:hypothetical protein
MGNEMLDPVVREGFSIRVEGKGPYSLVVSGNADMEMLPALSPFLVEFHDRLRLKQPATVTVDFRDLYFMNSSCFKAFIVWISNIKKLDSSERYSVRFVTNAAFSWQVRNIEAIQEFAPDIVIVAAD